MHTWHWQTWNDLPYLTCSLLKPWQHGFFTRHYSPRSPAELTPVLRSSAQTYRIKQIHGNIVLLTSKIAEAGRWSGTGEFPAADGLVSEQAAQAVWVCSADCTPVLIGDAVTGQVAAVHAGWRGTGLKIVPQAIGQMQAQGSQLQDLRVAMGPAIAGKVYQVSETVAAEVVTTIAAVATLPNSPNSPLSDDPEPGRVRLDVRRVNALQLEQLGLSPEQIAIAPHCTYQNSENFFSYRRSKEKQVQWSGIVSESEKGVETKE